MLTVQYNGPERTIGHTVWYPGETRQASAKELAGWQAEHGDMFVVVGGAEPVGTESSGAVVIEDNATGTDQAGQVTEDAPKGKRK